MAGSRKRVAGSKRTQTDYAKNILLLRSKTRLTQTRLAQKLGVKRGAVARWETYSRDKELRRKPKRLNFSALAKVARASRLEDLAEFFSRMAEPVGLNYEEAFAERYLAVVEKGAASGDRNSAYLLKLSEMARATYCMRVLKAIRRIKSPDHIVPRFEEAWHVMTLQVGRQARAKSEKRQQLQQKLEVVEESSPLKQNGLGTI